MGRYSDMLARLSGASGNPYASNDEAPPKARAEIAENPPGSASGISGITFSFEAPVGVEVTTSAPMPAPVNTNSKLEGRKKKEIPVSAPLPVEPPRDYQVEAELASMRLEAVLFGLQAAYADGALPPPMLRQILRYSCAARQPYDMMSDPVRAAVPLEEAAANYEAFVEERIRHMDAFASDWRQALGGEFQIDPWLFAEGHALTHSGKVARQFTKVAVEEFTREGDFVCDPAAFDVLVAQTAADMGRKVWALSPRGERLAQAKFQHAVGDLRSIARRTGEAARDGRMPRKLDLIISDLSGNPGAAPLIGGLWRDLHAALSPTGAFAVRVGFGQVPAVIDALDQAPVIHSLGDGTAALVVRLGGDGGSRVVNDDDGQSVDAVSAPVPTHAAHFKEFTSHLALAMGIPPMEKAEELNLPSPEEAGEAPFKVMSLFSGGGGMDLGFEMAGFKTVVAVEFDKQAAATLKANMPHVEVVNGDARKVPFNIWAGEVDVIIGGPPCQGFSQAGKMLGWGDPRSQLMIAYVDAVAQVRPAAFVLENVKALINPQNIAGWKVVVGRLEALGYAVEYRVLNSADYGVPQTRERLIAVGMLYGRFDFDTIPKFGRRVTLDEAIRHLRGVTVAKNDRTFQPIQYAFDTGGFASRFKEATRVRGWDRQGFTMVANSRGVPLHPDPVNAKEAFLAPRETYCFNRRTGTWHRRLTPVEGAAIQSFPADYKFCVTSIGAAYRIVGNAVPPLMAKAIATALKAALEKTRSLPCGKAA